MDSNTKFRQPAATIQAMLRRAYGEAETPPLDEAADWLEELGFGWFNAAYVCRLAGGRRVVLKIAPLPEPEVMTYEIGAMETELLTLDLIAGQTSVPVPEVEFADDSLEVCPTPWFAMPYVEGDTWGMHSQDWGHDVNADLWEQLGTLNREINTVVGTGYGPVRQPVHPTWRAAFTQLLADVVDDGRRRNVNLGMPYERVRELFEDRADSLDEVSSPQLVEWDLWPGNVIVRDGRIVSLLDHERAVFGDPLFEGGFNGGWLEGFSDLEAFFRGYGRSAEFTETERQRRELYVLYQMLVMVVETEFRGLTDPTQYEWAKATLADAVAQFVQPTRAGG
ncbi:phosphotransferase family protein [Aestuariimicrobium ganziense]|uniref:phosphotransferase family protein n=1 Tax=Aestuariimicrobium ganziense TaxID=2773677 RepID=UPI001940D75F|nr:aminoglycoside phosphotransferase family protein [Aestuariimicrobium ganziense]